MGTPAVTTRGFKEAECVELTHWMCDILEDVNDTAVIERVKASVAELCQRFPVYR